MMKNLFFGTLLLLTVFLSCRNNEDFQQIDQVVSIYIDSAGIDMLNPKIVGSYTNVRLNDVYGLTDTAPVNFSINKDQDTLNYISYVAGAKRIAIDSSDLSEKIYQSKIAFILSKKLNDTVSKVTNDTLTLHYTSSPSLFQIQKAWYNNQLVFTKTQGQANTIKIVK